MHASLPRLKLILLLVVIGSTAFISDRLLSIIDLASLDNYANQPIPGYINKDNTPNNNQITDIGATLGRVLFYDKKLSTSNTIACATCHQQEFAFSDPAILSTGVNGTTDRHSMRLVNARFANEDNFFWDERANSLEEQTTQPIQDHSEMGFSGANGAPGIDSLLRKMEETTYYADLFTAMFGDATITEQRMQLAMAQFIRSIQSFDAKFDAGLAQVGNLNQPFPNFTPQENTGKNLFLAPPQFNGAGQRVGGGLGCQGCHAAPEFDINPNSGNNGLIVSTTGAPDPTNTRSPSLRDIFNANGDLNSPLMHIGSAPGGGVFDFNDALDHYNVIPNNVPNLDPRLRPNGNPQRLNITAQERQNITAFMHTLSGTNVYTDLRWSDPFDANGNLTVVNAPQAYVMADIRVLLEGPFNPANNLMNDDLRSDNELPANEPYTGLGFIQVNNPGGETIVDATVFNTTGPNAILDWVFVDLCDKNDPTNIIATRSALLKRNGRVVDTDGVSLLRFDNVGPDDYYVGIRHRNHLRVHSANTIGLSTTINGVVDFIRNVNPIATPGNQNTVGNRLVLWSGDGSYDNAIDAADRSATWNLRNTGGYLEADVNMDGFCDAEDRSITWNNRNKTGM